MQLFSFVLPYPLYPLCFYIQRYANKSFFYSKHMDKHERPYICREPECEMISGFTYSGGLLRHEREVHKKHGGPRKPYFCPHANCKRSAGSGFTRRENLKEHMRRVHNDGSVTVTSPIEAGSMSDQTRSVPVKRASVDSIEDEHQQQLFKRPRSSTLISTLSNSSTDSGSPYPRTPALATISNTVSSYHSHHSRHDHDHESMAGAASPDLARGIAHVRIDPARVETFLQHPSLESLHCAVDQLRREIGNVHAHMMRLERVKEGRVDGG
jgi:hypothetical protein